MDIWNIGFNPPTTSHLPYLRMMPSQVNWPMEKFTLKKGYPTSTWIIKAQDEQSLAACS